MVGILLDRVGARMPMGIGSLLAGLSRPVTSKSLRELEEEGLLSVEHGLIRVIDANALSNYEV